MNLLNGMHASLNSYKRFRFYVQAYSICLRSKSLKSFTKKQVVLLLFNVIMSLQTMTKPYIYFSSQVAPVDRVKTVRVLLNRCRTLNFKQTKVDVPNEERKLGLPSLFDILYFKKKWGGDPHVCRQLQLASHSTRLNRFVLQTEQSALDLPLGNQTGRTVKNKHIPKNIR